MGSSLQSEVWLDVCRVLETSPLNWWYEQQLYDWAVINPQRSILTYLTGL